MTSDRDTLHGVHAVTDTALAHLDVASLVAELLVRVRDQLRADTATVLLLDPYGEELVATASVGLEAEVAQGVRIPVGPGFAGRVAASRAAVQLQEVGPASVLNPILIERGVRSIIGVPMIAAGQLVGVVHVGSLHPRLFTDDEVNVLQVAADRMALATQAQQTAVDRAATVALQRSLLPARHIELPGLQVAARYVPGAQSAVGGDWYDVFALPSGHVGVAIGDVAGHGLRAAVVMGRIRSALRAYALESDDPADVLTRLDRKITIFEPGALATAVYAVISPDLTRIRLSLAGPPAAGAGLARPARPPGAGRAGSAARGAAQRPPPGDRTAAAARRGAAALHRRPGRAARRGAVQRPGAAAWHGLGRPGRAGLRAGNVGDGRRGHGRR